MTEEGRGVLALAILVVLSCGSAVASRPAPGPSIPERVVQAECVVVGEVVRVEDRTVKAVPHCGVRARRSNIRSPSSGSPSG